MFTDVYYPVLTAAGLREPLCLHEEGSPTDIWKPSNISKTKVVIFSRGKVKKYPKFYIDTDEVEVKIEYVYLGVFLYKSHRHEKQCMH